MVRALATSAGDSAVKTKKNYAVTQNQASNGKAIMKKLRIGSTLPS